MAEEKTFTGITGQDTVTVTASVDPEVLGYGSAIEDVQQYLIELGKVLCFVLDLLPNKEISIPVEIPEGCTLILSIKKG